MHPVENIATFVFKGQRLYFEGSNSSGGNIKFLSSCKELVKSYLSTFNYRNIVFHFYRVTNPGCMHNGIIATSSDSPVINFYIEKDNYYIYEDLDYSILLTIANNHNWKVGDEIFMEFIKRYLIKIERVPMVEVTPIITYKDDVCKIDYTYEIKDLPNKKYHIVFEIDVAKNTIKKL